MNSIKATVADAFRGLLEPEAIVVEFGQNQDRASSTGERTIALSDRIVMPPRTAKRLISTLNDCLRRYGSAPHSAGSRVPVPAEAAPAALRGEIPVNAPPDRAGQKAALLFQLVSNLRVPFQYERSFRMSGEGLLANRLLLTLNKGDIAGDPHERVLDICRRLDMPHSLEGQAGEHFATANCVHFGFEGDGDSIICKLYLEREFTAQEADRAKADAAPIVLHLAFKWDILKDTHVVTRYLWYPRSSATDIERRLALVYRGGQPETSFEIAKAALNLAASRAPAERLQYLEVQEDENDRRSFDLNLYDAHLQVKDFWHLLSRMRGHYGIRPGQFQALYDQIKTKALGHLAGGVHRNGRDFFNIYYGVEGYPRFSGPFR